MLFIVGMDTSSAYSTKIRLIVILTKSSATFSDKYCCKITPWIILKEHYKRFPFRGKLSIFSFYNHISCELNQIKEVYFVVVQLRALSIVLYYVLDPKLSILKGGHSIKYSALDNYK